MQHFLQEHYYTIENNEKQLVLDAFSLESQLSSQIICFPLHKSPSERKGRVEKRNTILFLPLSPLTLLKCFINLDVYT